MREELKHRMLKHLNFLEMEMRDYSKFKKLTWLDYTTDADKRRSVERWTENIINSSIDISKNILTLEGINLPDNYKEMVLLTSSIKGFGFDKAELLAQWVKFRNIISQDMPAKNMPKLLEIIHSLKTSRKKGEKKATVKKRKDTLWDLKNIAVETGIKDLAEHYDHYLYGIPYD